MSARDYALHSELSFSFPLVRHHFQYRFRSRFSASRNRNRRWTPCRTPAVFFHCSDSYRLSLKKLQFAFSLPMEPNHIAEFICPVFLSVNFYPFFYEIE